jgi:2-haloacid dehalogenase
MLTLNSSRYRVRDLGRGAVALAFDVNETLLDLRALDEPFERVFGDPAARTQWFGQLLQSALVSTVTDAYTDFGTIARAALLMVAARRERELTAEEEADILGTMVRLPPHPEVYDALERLRAGGYRLATLTNSTEEVARAQLEHAGLAMLFERILSADSIRRLKPAPEPYRMAAVELGVPIGGLRLVAAHAWDVAGALRAGCQAAFVARPGMVRDPLAPMPDIVGGDMTEIADRLLET